MVVEMVLVLGAALLRARRRCRRPPTAAAGYSNTKELGRLLYTDYVYPFEIAAVILLVAIVAAIALTLRQRKDTQVSGPGAAGRGAARGPRAHRVDAGRRSRTERRTPVTEHGGTLISLSHYLMLGAMLFAISVVGIFLNRKNVIVLLMAIELMLLAVNMNFVAFSHFLGDLGGQVFVFFILTVAAAESAIGLAILVVLFRNLRTINVDDLDQLKG